MCKYINTSTFNISSMTEIDELPVDKIPPRELIGDFAGGTFRDPVSGQVTNIHQIQKHYPGGDLSPTVSLAIVGVLIAAIGVYAYMTNKPVPVPETPVPDLANKTGDIL
jgi:hypothetical protein